MDGRWALACVLSLVAGCAAAPPEGTPGAATSGSTPIAADEASLVHRDGHPAAASLFPGPFARFEKHWVGEVEGNEPSVAIAHPGSLLYVSNTGSRADVWRTRDEGATWTLASPLLTADNQDPYLEADPRHGRVWYLVMPGPEQITCTHVHWTDDDGANWESKDVGDCFALSIFDHPVLAAGPAPAGSGDDAAYLCGRQALKVVCRASLDQGKTWSPSHDTGLDFGCFFGLPVVSPVSGRVFLPQTCGESRVAMSDDGGVTWTSRTVFPAAWKPRDIVSDAPLEFEIAVDASGDVYALGFDAHRLPQLSVSRDDGMSWSSPINASRPGLTSANRAMAVAGSTGRLALGYVGTESASPAAAAAKWNVYVAMTLDALDAQPLFATTRVNAATDPVYVGDCSARCGVRATMGPDLPTQNMGDFLRMTMDPGSGRIYLPFVDLCDDACGGGAGGRDLPARAALGVQVDGVSLTG